MFLQEVKNVQVLIDIFSVFRLLVSSVIPRDKSFLKWREKLKYPSVKEKLPTNRKQSRLSRFKPKQGNHRVRPPKTYVGFRTDSLCFSCYWVASFSLCFTFFLCFSLFFLLFFYPFLSAYINIRPVLKAHYWAIFQLPCFTSGGGGRVVQDRHVCPVLPSRQYCFHFYRHCHMVNFWFRTMEMWA